MTGGRQLSFPAAQYLHPILAINDSTAVRPIFPALNQPRPNRILAYILPFLCLALIAAHEVVKEALLPLEIPLTRHSLQCLDPLTERSAMVPLMGNEVKVVGHQHVLRRPPFITFRAVEQERHHPLVHWFIRQNTETPFHTESQVIAWGRVPCPNELKSTQTPW